MQRGRDLYRIRPDGSDLQPVLVTDADERSPAFDAQGQMLYFASDASGIFNLYRMAVENPGAPERLTNVLGGAFMPAVGPTGRIAFAQYQWDGYKIAMLETPDALPEAARLATYTPPDITQKQGVPALAAADWAPLNAFDDADLRPLPGETISAVRTEGGFPLYETDGSQPETEGAEARVERYGSLFTSFSFYPVLRLDQYVSRQRTRMDARLPDRTRGETFLRNTKVGTYLSSR